MEFELTQKEVANYEAFKKKVLLKNPMAIFSVGFTEAYFGFFATAHSSDGESIFLSNGKPVPKEGVIQN